MPDVQSDANPIVKSVMTLLEMSKERANRRQWGNGWRLKKCAVILDFSFKKD